MSHARLLPTISLLAALVLAPGCTEDGAESGAEPGEASGDASSDEPETDAPAGYVVASVVISDVGRTTYVSIVPALEGHLTNEAGVEIPGNAVYLVDGASVLVGLTEEPTWVKYTLDSEGRLQEAGRMSLAAYGLAAVDFGNALVDSTTAVSVSSDALLAVVWNPEAMTITGTIDLAHLHRDGYDLENWTTNVGPDGLVYIPARWANWDEARILPSVTTTIVDPVALEVVGVAEDDRCASGGRVVFDEAGYGYVMGDGRNYAIQMIANAQGLPAPENCLLRIPPGGTDFEEGFYASIPALTGGLEVITELETAEQGTGVGFAKIFHPDRLPEGVEPVDFEFWGYNAHQTWRIELGDEPRAMPVEGAPFSAVGFSGVATEGVLYVGESEDGGASTTVYGIDPVANRMDVAFTMDGYFYGAHALR